MKAVIGLYLPPYWKYPMEYRENMTSISSWDIPQPHAAVLVSSKSCAFDFRTQTWCLRRLFSFMSAKVWTPNLRDIFLFCTSLCTGIRKKVSMWVYVTMDCLKGIYNGIGIRFFLMALIKIWTLVMYVLQRNLKKVCFVLQVCMISLRVREMETNTNNMKCLVFVWTQCLCKQIIC